MKIPLSWLKEYIDLPYTPDEVAEFLTLIGIEVDKIEATPLSFEGVVVAKVIEVSPHPNADKLKIAKVFDGKEEFQVVCGGANCREGLITAFAKIGASLQDEKEKRFIIKKSKLRDVESFGMLCAGDELGIESHSEGILELDSSFTLGTDLASFYAQTVFDLSLTPNLGHCMSVYGIARELSAFLNKPLKPLQSCFEQTPSSPSPIFVDIQDKKHCLRYSCRLVQNVKVGPSPEWLVKKLEESGLRSINNVVDISNYVLTAVGQPLHFFDFDELVGSHLSIESTSSEITVDTLDDVSRTIPPGSLVICDQKGPVAIGGIMGCKRGSVSEKTQNVLIEAAVFAPASIRKTSKALGLKTDSSSRFEKGTDPFMTSFALDLATRWLIELAEGSACHEKIDEIPHPFSQKKIVCREQKVNDLLGIHISLREIASFLERLGIKILQEHSSSLEVAIPFHRNDLNIEADLIEEIGKLYGLGNLPKKASLYSSSALPDSSLFVFENKARHSLLEEGLQEFMTCDLISPALAELTKDSLDSSIETLCVLQSKSSDYSILRPSLLPGFLELLRHNISLQNRDLAGFEVGRIHFKEKDLYQERTSLAILLSGQKDPHHHEPQPRLVDFFDMKGILENLLETLRVDKITFEPSYLHTLQPGRQAYIKRKGLCLGVLGEIHPFLLEKLGICQRAYFAEINLQELLKLSSQNIKVKELPLYPGSERDWTLSLRKETPVGEVLSCIQSLAPSLLEKVFLLDLFESEKIGTDRKNATFRLIYRDKTKTLDLKTVEESHTKLLQRVAEKLHDCIL